MDGYNLTAAARLPSRPLQRMSGRGKIHNYVIYQKAWTPWFESRVPYAVIQVELEEGPRLTTNLLDVPAAQTKIGMPVEAAYEDITDEITLLQFRPAKR
ncbi:MAG: OB-fold domain-containing protein [Anaerolineaceae bacterium]